MFIIFSQVFLHVNFGEGRFLYFEIKGMSFKIEQFRRHNIFRFIYENGKRICQRGSVEWTYPMREDISSRADKGRGLWNTIRQIII